MRGGLDDALDRLARMDQLRRRAGGTSGDLPTAHGLAEAIEAVRRVVERYPDLNITLYGEQGEGSAEVRIGWEDGVVRAKIISVEGPEGASFGPSEGPLPVLPAEIPPMTDLPRPLPEATRPRVDVYPAGRRAEQAPVPDVPRLVDPGRLGDRRRRRAAPDAGFLPDPGALTSPQPAATPPAAPSAWTEPAPAGEQVRPDDQPMRSAWTEPTPAGEQVRPDDQPMRSAWTEPAPAGEQVRPGDLPMRSAPRAWKAEHEDNPGAAARLAAMIREDPSLLAGPEER